MICLSVLLSYFTTQQTSIRVLCLLMYLLVGFVARGKEGELVRRIDGVRTYPYMTGVSSSQDRENRIPF